ESLTDNVGIASLRLEVDGVTRELQDYRSPNAPPWDHCDFTMRRPCHDVTGGLSLDTGALSDGRHTIRVVATDAAGNAASRDHVIDVDNTPPGRVDASVDGGGGWRRRNAFTIRWPDPVGQASPIA